MPEEHFGAKTTSDQPSFIGIILGILIIVLMAVLGGLYLWGAQLQQQLTAPLPELTPTRPSDEENNEPESNNAEADVQVLQTLSTSDEISAIEADIESTNLDTLDAEITTLDGAFGE